MLGEDREVLPLPDGVELLYGPGLPLQLLLVPRQGEVVEPQGPHPHLQSSVSVKYTIRSIVCEASCHLAI